MRLLEDEPSVGEFRNALMQFLNEFGLDAAAILSLARRTEPVAYESGEAVLKQGEFETFVYFLVAGNIEISIQQNDRTEVLGERGPVNLLGEISYFNSTPATATVAVKQGGTASFLRLSYDEFTDVIEEYPQIKPTLARIGDMRVIAQMSGFTPFKRFMDMIGWKRDRLAVNRAVFSYLEEAISFRLLPRLNETSKVLEVGDGPGIVSEIIRELNRDWEDNLFLQATHLEDAILNPLMSYPSDFSRARYLKERFDGIVTLQLFENLKPDAIPEQFALATQLLADDGFLLVIRLRVVDVSHTSGQQDATLLFNGLEDVVRRVWPGVIDNAALVKVGFLDADIDPMMEWNPDFCDAVIGRKLTIPDDETGVERLLLEVLLKQARRRIFDPEEINFHWIVWHAARHGLVLEDSDQNPEVSFYYQLYRRDTAAGTA